MNTLAVRRLTYFAGLLVVSLPVGLSIFAQAAFAKGPMLTYLARVAHFSIGLAGTAMLFVGAAFLLLSLTMWMSAWRGGDAT